MMLCQRTNQQTRKYSLKLNHGADHVAEVFQKLDIKEIWGKNSLCTDESYFVENVFKEFVFHT